MHTYFRLGCIFKKNLSAVKRAGVIPFVVFDGLLLPAKSDEVKLRQMFDFELVKYLFIAFTLMVLKNNFFTVNKVKSFSKG